MNGNRILNHYSIFFLFIYLTLWILGYPFFGDFLKFFFLDPHHLIVLVLLTILWGFIGFNIYIIWASGKADNENKEK